MHSSHTHLTMAEKVLSRKTGRLVRAGDLVTVSVDGIMASDTTAPYAIKTFHEMGGVELFDPSKLSLVIDHAAPAPNERIANLHTLVRDFAHQHKVKLYDVGEGICHQLMIENRHVLPGDLFIGADSHTCTYGAIAAFATGVGSTDLAAIMLTGETWLRAPQTIRVEIEGELEYGVSAKDVILHIVGEIGLAGATYQALEFHGSAVEQMSLDSRMTLANMTVEMGGKVGFVTPTGLRGYDLDLDALLPDPDAEYVRTLTIRAEDLGYRVSKPPYPDQVFDIQEVIGTPIQYAFIGTCANGRLEDLRTAARILDGQSLAQGVRLMISPASKEVFKQALMDGTALTLMNAGATFLTSGCGPCVGTHQGVPGSGETVISTANRNFQGRMGNPQADVYLSSPSVVAASALRGYITHERAL